MLDVTDLVMIGPVGSGFSKPLGAAKGADFWGVDDLAGFIRDTDRLQGRCRRSMPVGVPAGDFGAAS